MACVDQPDPDLLVFRSGGGVLVLFGLPFLLAGLFVTALTLGFAGVREDAPPLHIGLPFGGLFAAVGASVVFGRAGATIDRRRQSLVKWWGLSGLSKKSEYFLPDFCEVTLRKEVRRGDKSSYTVHPIGLKSETLSKTIVLEEPRDYAEARALAERVAKLLDRPLVDSSSGTPVVRQPDALDRSLRDSVRRSGGRVAVPDPPAELRSHVSVEGTRVAIEIPASGLGAARKLVIGALFAILALDIPFLLPIFSRSGAFEWVDLPLFAATSALVSLVPLLGVGGLLLSLSRKRVRVSASAAGLRVEESSPLRSAVTEIPGDELEELELFDFEAYLASQRGSRATAPAPPGAGGPKPAALPPALGSLLGLLGRGNRITARSDRVSVSFGNGLSTAEAEYLTALIKRALAS